MARAFAVKIPARPHYLSLFTYRSLIYLGLQPVTYRSLSIPQAVPYLSLFTYHSLIYLGLQPVTYRSLSISPWQSLAYRTSSARSLTYLGRCPKPCNLLPHTSPHAFDTSTFADLCPQKSVVTLVRHCEIPDWTISSLPSK